LLLFDDSDDRVLRVRLFVLFVAVGDRQGIAPPDLSHGTIAGRAPLRGRFFCCASLSLHSTVIAPDPENDPNEPALSPAAAAVFMLVVIALTLITSIAVDRYRAHAHQPPSSTHP